MPSTIRLVQVISKILALLIIIPFISTSTLPRRDVSPVRAHPLKARAPAPLPDYRCKPYPLTPKSWKDLQIDEYLLNYPGGTTNVNLATFALQNNASNFDCGLNHFCTAGQLCFPLAGRAWWVLVAVEQMTFYQNQLYAAISFAALKLKSIASSLTVDLVEQTHEKHANLWQAIGMAFTLALAVVSLIAAAVFVFVPGLQVFAAVAAAGAMVAIVQVSAFLKAHHEEILAGRQDKFIAYATLNDELGKWENDATTAVSNHFQSIISSPISLETGLYGALKNGEFCRNSRTDDENDLKLKIARVLEIRLIGRMLRAKQAFITLNSDRCNQGGTNGAFPLDKGWLSYCDKQDGTMMNVIYDNNGQSGNAIHGAEKIVNKYKLSAEYITRQAHDCYYSHGNNADYDPYASGENLPTDENAPCLINLPVCNLAEHAVHKYKKKHRATTVTACRMKGGIVLP